MSEQTNRNEWSRLPWWMRVLLATGLVGATALNGGALPR
jgi:hypothetical protein